MSLREKVCQHIWKPGHYPGTPHTHACLTCRERRNEKDLDKQDVCYYCGFEIKPHHPKYAIRYTEKPKGTPDRWHTIGVTCEVCEGRHGSYIDNSAPIKKETKEDAAS